MQITLAHTPFAVKLLLVLALLAVVASLFAALREVLAGGHHARRAARALTLRVALSLALFLLILLGMATGVVVPHGPGG